tara:strand:- start:1296 stop:1589 length:294 start_codon:yes stop_codon:yes gene_type:complete
MLDSLLGAVASNSGLLAGGGTAAVILWVLKKVPNESICSVVETAFESLGKVMTLGLGKWGMTKKFWNSTIEPWFIDLVDNVFGSMVRGFIKGLRSDN